MWCGLLPYMKRRLERYKPYILAREVKWSIASSLKRLNEQTVVSLPPDQPSQGNVLLSYKQAFEMFLLGPSQPIPSTHTNYWASMQMTKTFLDLGYCVDVIHHENSQHQPYEEMEQILTFEDRAHGPNFSIKYYNS